MEAADHYTTGFYDEIRTPAQLSAATVVPDLVELFKPTSVIDVGCGEGHWALAFRDHGGASVFGIDGAYVENPVVPFRAVDLNQPLPADLGRFGMAVCLEVAEHLDPERGPSFIADLCTLSDVVVFSAATPEQPGHGHVNCQWPAYWADLFVSQGFATSSALRWRYWGRDNEVEWWYQQNLMVAAREPHYWPTVFDTPMAAPHAVVHPILWKWSVTQ